MARHQESWAAKGLILQRTIVTDTMNEDYDDYTSQKGYLVFNRFRVLEYAKGNLAPDLNNQIRTWVNSALTKIDRRL
jgi:hypothetical protein